MKRTFLILLFSAGVFQTYAQGFHYLVLNKNAHPAVKTAAALLAKKLHIPPGHILKKNQAGIPKRGEIVLDEGIPSEAQEKFLGRDPRKVAFDGYVIRFRGASALIFGKRPRSLLYAAGDANWWREKRSGIYVRQPDFRIRDINKGAADDIATLIAETGANIVFDNIHPDFITLKASFPKVFNAIPIKERARLVKKENEAAARGQKLIQACHDADVDFYPFLYGNDIVRWNPILANAIYTVYPDIAGVRAPHSWEKATLNPSLPVSWKIIRALVAEYIKTLPGDGMIATFWDDYGLYSQDSLSVASGMNRFDNELQKIVGVYHQVLDTMHKSLIIRTWSSGRAHWVTLLNNKGLPEQQFVHAPGYGGFSGNRLDVWGKVIDSLPAEVMLQTKSYMSDCFPAARNNTLIGHTGAHPQIIEYQMTGQTTGLYYLPAVNVAYTDSTIKRAYRLIGKNGGTNVFYGATHQPHFNLVGDLLNSINLYAWKELSWNVNADVHQIWMQWAVPRYGTKAAPDIIKALKLSEPAVNKVFSTLGFGWDTNSGFPGTINRREVLLTYTNRFYLPAYRQYLLPNKENIQRVIDEKNSALVEIDSMFFYLDRAKPFLDTSQYRELSTRFSWLKYVAIENKALEVSYWRYRYLRYLYSLRTTDTAQLDTIRASMHTAIRYRDSLFRYAPGERFSCYDLPLGEINQLKHISLGNPLSLMKEIFGASRKFEQEFTGPAEPMEKTNNLKRIHH